MPDIILVYDEKQQEHYLSLAAVAGVHYYTAGGSPRAEVTMLTPSADGKAAVLRFGDESADAVRRAMRQRAGLDPDEPYAGADTAHTPRRSMPEAVRNRKPWHV